MVVAPHCYLTVCSIKREACLIPPLTHFTVFGRDLLTEPLPAQPHALLADLQLILLLADWSGPACRMLRCTNPSLSKAERAA